MKIKKGRKLYEGKAKIIYATDNPDLVIQYFKDDATAFDATKRGTINDKGIVNNKLSAIFFTLLEKKGVPTHFVELLSDREMLVKKVEIIPLEVTMRNIAAGGLSKLLNIPEGTVLKRPLLEFHYKDDALHDPLITDEHILILGFATKRVLDKIKEYSYTVNKVLKNYFKKIGINLVDFKLEFGKYKNKILLADEISPDTMRLWDIKTNKKLDKDRFRRDLGNIEEAYQEVLKRVNDISSRGKK